MNTLRFLRKTSLQVLKTAVSFATGMVITFYLLYVLVSERWLPRIQVGAGRFILLAAFAGGFYLTFKLLEPRMPARKKLLVALLGIVLPLVSLFSVAHTPTLEITEIFRWPSPPSSPKRYEEAIYDVYSDFLSQQEGPGLNRLLSPPLELVLIRVETLTFQEPGPSGPPSGLERWLGIDPKEERFKPAVDSAIADYLKRNTDVLELQKKFNLPHYDLFTKDEEKGFYFGDHSLCQKYSGYERWVELSAVGFNQDQTVAVVHFIDWRGRPCNGHTLIGATGKDRMLQKRDGKWHLLPSRIFSDWTLDS